MRTSRAFLIGVGTAYFFDPRQGRRRRHVARDRGTKTVRQMTRAVRRKARFGAGKAQGAYSRGRGFVSSPEMATDDAVVEQRIRSEAFRHLDVAASDLAIGVENGIVSLTGSIAGDRPAAELIARIGKIPGVEDVAAMLYVVNDAPSR